jgi:glycosyltransferase 2 family protein
MSRGSRRRLLSLVQYALCVLAVAYLVHKVPWHSQVFLQDGTSVRLVEQVGHDVLQVERAGRPEVVSLAEVQQVTIDGRRVPRVELGMKDVLRRLNRKWAIYSLLLFAPVVVLQAYRLVVMVAVQGVRLSLWHALKLNLAGNFFNFALPGTTGGDLVKAYYLSRYTHLKTEVVTTVFLDRVIGLGGLVLLALGAMAVTHELHRFEDSVAAVGVFLLLFGAATAALFSGRVRRRLRVSRWVERLPAGRQLLRIGQATLALRQNKRRVLVAISLSLLLQAICALSAAVMAWALGMRGPGATLDQLLYFTGYVSVGFLIAAVPLTPQGVGVLEAAYIQFFAASGWNTPSQAVALAFAVRLIQLAWAVPGVLVPVLGAHLPGKRELVGFGDPP